LTTGQTSPKFSEFSLSACLADIPLVGDCIAIDPQFDHLTALAASAWLIGGRVTQLFEIVFVGPIVNIHLGIEGFTTLGAILPMAFVSLTVMIAAKRVAVMVSTTAIAGIRKHHVLIFVIANPLAATFGLG
jgi:hypothetical protein